MYDIKDFLANNNYCMITIGAKRVFIYMHVRKIASDIFGREGDGGQKFPI